MKRIAWITDIHLNFAEAPDPNEFLQRVVAANPDIVLIGGDIAESQNLLAYLKLIDNRLQRPVHFVLGNHDFYHGSIHHVRDLVRQLCIERPRLHYLTQESVFELTTNVGLVGDDGWADARFGDYLRSYVVMNDYRLIAELSQYNKETRWTALHALGDEAAERMRPKLSAALEQFPQVFLLTHVPPVLEACWHEGKISDNQWSPHFTCKAMGDMILEIAARHPDKALTVLCGHTHGSGEARPLPNVRIITGGAEYGRPSITHMFELV